MHATPKAIDFDAYTLDGTKLSPLDSRGLQARWDVAEICSSLNLLQLTTADRQAINRACQRVGSKYKLTLKFGG